MLTAGAHAPKGRMPPSPLAKADDGASLEGRTVLLVEDQAMVALELEFALEDAGATVIGPIAYLRDAVEAAGRDAAIDVALLDVDLNGEAVFPAADLLMERGVPFAFHTGHASHEELSADYPHARVCIKPTTSERILRVLEGLL